MGLFRKGKIGIVAKFHRTDLVIGSHSRGTKTQSYSQINMVVDLKRIYAKINNILCSDFPGQVAVRVTLSVRPSMFRRQNY